MGPRSWLSKAPNVRARGAEVDALLRMGLVSDVHSVILQRRISRSCKSDKASWTQGSSASPAIPPLRLSGRRSGRGGWRAGHRRSVQMIDGALQAFSFLSVFSYFASGAEAGPGAWVRVGRWA